MRDDRSRAGDSTDWTKAILRAKKVRPIAGASQRLPRRGTRQARKSAIDQDGRKGRTGSRWDEWRARAGPSTMPPSCTEGQSLAAPTPAVTAAETARPPRPPRPRPPPLPDTADPLAARDIALHARNPRWHAAAGVLQTAPGRAEIAFERRPHTQLTREVALSHCCIIHSLGGDASPSLRSIRWPECRCQSRGTSIPRPSIVSKLQLCGCHRI